MREQTKKLWINFAQLRIWLTLATRFILSTPVERQPKSGSQTLLENLRSHFWSHGTYAGSAIDDATWDDLGLDSLYGHLDCNFSNFGASQMYLQMRLGGGGHVFNQKTPLQIYSVSTAQLHEAFKPVIGVELEAATKVRSKSLPTQTLNIKVAVIQTLLIPALVFLSVLHWSGLVALIGALVLNIWTHLKYQHDTAVKLTFLNAVRSVVTASSNIKAIDFACSSDDSQFVSDVEMGNTLLGRLRWYNISGKNIDPISSTITDILDYLFLRALIFTDRSLSLVAEHADSVAFLACRLGEIDSEIAISRYKLNNNCCQTDFSSDNPKRLFFEDVVHPLITAPVANCIDMDHQSALITGSNMAGKTTLLRTIAINVVLAQAFGFCHARRCAMSRFKLMSSIQVVDSMSNGDSLFYAELLRIKQLLDFDAENITPLYLIDEIFRGTNAGDRVALGSAVLRRLANKGPVFVTTHELALAKVIGDDFNKFYFGELISNDILHYDFKLKHGVWESRSAYALAKSAGFSDEIVDAAYKLRFKSVPKCA